MNRPLRQRRDGRRMIAVGGSGYESVEWTRTVALPLLLKIARGHCWLSMQEAGEISLLREIVDKAMLITASSPSTSTSPLLAPCIMPRSWKTPCRAVST